MYVITAATGNIGSRIARRLLGHGQKVRVVSRKRQRLQSLIDEGAQAVIGSAEDKAFVRDALQGATAAFTLIPPNFHAEDLRAHQKRIGESLVEAIRESGVKHVVNLSSLGAHLPSGTGPIAGLYEQEQRLNALERVHILHLRPSFFFENFLGNIPMIKQMGINGSPVKGDVAFPALATQDIAEYAAERLLNLDFSGKSVQELLGPKDITMLEATRILGKAIGRPDLPYVQFTFEEAEKGMIQGGLSPDVARNFIEMQRAMNEGTGIAGTPRTKENTTKTTLEEYAQKFAEVYNNV